MITTTPRQNTCQIDPAYVTMSTQSESTILSQNTETLSPDSSGSLTTAQTHHPKTEHSPTPNANAPSEADGIYPVVTRRQGSVVGLFQHRPADRSRGATVLEVPSVG
ncbi:hypothetical protein CCHR01_05387 [Colletotrichum chrysophilum]|uniref:Uncharacterized protein n=1 Tax=Colletotrichum chrysophilum TaxID=1836956 RepID=A0AAD9EHN2_9PEZI|nr:hypothetical protein CCHR01_05387 [Colletotrichum chrysophilum]